MNKPKKTPAACPCQSTLPFSACCGRWSTGNPAPDPALLMRSRYSAYVQGNTAWLLETWHPSTRPAAQDLECESHTQWHGLTIRHRDMQDADHATVEFVARYKVAGRSHRMHEISRFVRENGCWYYVDGSFPE